MLVDSRAVISAAFSRHIELVPSIEIVSENILWSKDSRRQLNMDGRDRAVHNQPVCHRYHQQTHTKLALFKKNPSNSLGTFNLWLRLDAYPLSLLAVGYIQHGNIG